MIYTNPIALRFCTYSKIIQMYVKNTTNMVFCSLLFVGVFLQAEIGLEGGIGVPKHGGPLNSTGARL
jgi:hypothetical protein